MQGNFTCGNVTILKRHLTKVAVLADYRIETPGYRDMQINFDKARKLINELELKLNETSAHTAAARKTLDEWIQSGESGLRRKGASALKQVRKRADSFTKALTKLEHNLASSLDKMSESLEKKADKKSPKKKAAKKTAAKKTAAKKAAKKGPGKKKAAKKAPAKKA